jgi:hypothetical protein
LRCLQPEGNKQQTMYRYCVDNAVSYTSEDFVLFRESPFACWMERLTLENPDHGIPPDLDSHPPENSMQRQDELGDTLRAEGKKVFIVDWDIEEPLRRQDTLEAMRKGVDFIVNGQLALGPLSGSANLLMRTSGYSDLGNYLYIPCDTQAKTTLHSAFRLCFLADLLHSLQGQLPPQMLIIRGGSDLLPLQTEDHIYHYRAVKQRFMDTMRSFRKHRMPDPAESSHFGRWSDCANEILKQRALRGEEPLPAADQQESSDIPLPQVAAAAAPEPLVVEAQQPQQPQRSRFGSKGMAVSGTLADQAKMLHSGEQPAQPQPQPQPQPRERATDNALRDLEFIGRVASPPPVLNTESTEFEVDCIDDSDYQLPADPVPEPESHRGIDVADATEPPEWVDVPPFNSSLNTAGTDQD